MANGASVRQNGGVYFALLIDGGSSELHIEADPFVLG
jgi:hypothetical protein